VYSLPIAWVTGVPVFSSNSQKFTVKVAVSVVQCSGRVRIARRTAAHHVATGPTSFLDIGTFNYVFPLANDSRFVIHVFSFTQCISMPAREMPHVSVHASSRHGVVGLSWSSANFCHWCILGQRWTDQILKVKGQGPRGLRHTELEVLCQAVNSWKQSLLTTNSWSTLEATMYVVGPCSPGVHNLFEG